MVGAVPPHLLPGPERGGPGVVRPVGVQGRGEENVGHAAALLGRGRGLQPDGLLPGGRRPVLQEERDVVRVPPRLCSGPSLAREGLGSVDLRGVGAPGAQRRAMGASGLRPGRRALCREGLLRRARHAVLRSEPVALAVPPLVSAGCGGRRRLRGRWHAHALGGPPGPPGGARRGGVVGEGSVLGHRGELHGHGLLPRSRAPLLQAERLLGAVPSSLQRGARPREWQPDVGLRAPRPGELGPRPQGLPLALLRLPLHAQRVRGAAAEGAAPCGRGHLPVRRLRCLRFRALLLGERGRGRCRDPGGPGPEDRCRDLQGRHSGEREALHGLLG
mmetsp:Transcript_99135/g.286046  ORF Transcript_99135/g.286046 Transcript_99135/m.286046 type:complete len:331 (-) Transcript_99135:780-1772(-)